MKKSCLARDPALHAINRFAFCLPQLFWISGAVYSLRRANAAGKFGGATEEGLQILSTHPLTQPEQDMVLDALATVVHSPRMAEQDRVALSRLADLLHCAWSGTWHDLPSGGKGIKWFKCRVPDLDPEIWPKVLNQKKLNRDFLGFAATSVRGLLAALTPPAKTLLRELSWMEIAQRELSTESQILS